MMNKMRTVMVLAAMISGCTLDDSKATGDGLVEGMLAEEVCGEMPWPPPGWSLISVPGTTGQVCMTDNDYTVKDRYDQDVNDYARCLACYACMQSGRCDYCVAR